MADLRRLWPVAALAAWTFFVWTTRIGNVWSDDDLDTGGRLSRTGLALIFTAMALVVVVALWKRPGWLRRSVGALVVWTVVTWAVRGVTLLAGDHSAAFKVVHTVLGVVSVALAILADRAAGAVPDRETERATA